MNERYLSKQGAAVRANAANESWVRANAKLRLEDGLLSKLRQDGKQLDIVDTFPSNVRLRTVRCPYTSTKTI